MFLLNGQVSIFTHTWTGPPLLFVHNQRCGGTSVNGRILDNYREVTCKFGKAISGEGEIGIEQAGALLRKGKRSLYLGHFFFGFDRLLGRRLKVATNFRNPRARLVSTYRQFSMPGQSFADWLGRNPWHENHLVRQLAGPTGATGSTLSEVGAWIKARPITEADLDAAIRNLGEVSFIFNCEDLERSIIMFERAYGTVPLLSAMGVRRHAAPVPFEPTPEDERLIDQATALDERLAEHLRGRYDEQARRFAVSDADIRTRELFAKVFDSVGILKAADAPMNPPTVSFPVIREGVLRALDELGADDRDALMALCERNENIRRFLA